MAQSGIGDLEEWYKSMVGVVFDPATSADLLEKFSQLRPGESQVKFCIKRLRMIGASLHVSSSRVKSNESAQKFRKIGNDLFLSNEDTAKVAEMYTKSIAYALPGSQELSFAYANRSAVAFKAGDYEECLLDIERSFENNYPEEMKAKLFARRVKCLRALEKLETDIEKALEDTRQALLKMDLKASGRNLVEKTLTDENPTTPTPSTKKQYSPLTPPAINDDSCSLRGATGIAIDYSEKYGRHLVATRDIRPGEIIAVIDSYAHKRATKNCYRDCNHCAEATPYGIPCEHCVNVTYCSTFCRDAAWEDYHQNECPVLGDMLNLATHDLMILGIRIALKAVREAGSVEQLKKLVKKIDSVSDPRLKGFTGNVFDCMKYAAFYTLTWHGGKHDDESYLISVMATVVTAFLATRTEIFGRKYNNAFEAFKQNPLLAFLGGLIIRNCEILEMTASKGGEDLRITPITALCNHSCDSNVMCVSTEKSVANIPHQRVMYTLRPIKAGEQLWDTYGHYHYSTHPKEMRQKALQKNFFFTCDCVPCVQNWPMYAELPSVFKMPGLSPTVRAQLSKLEKTLQEKFDESEKTGDSMIVKDVIVEWLELLYEHACPCNEIIRCRAKLMETYNFSYCPSRCTPLPKGN